MLSAYRGIKITIIISNKKPGGALDPPRTRVIGGWSATTWVLGMEPGASVRTSALDH